MRRNVLEAGAYIIFGTFVVLAIVTSIWNYTYEPSGDKKASAAIANQIRACEKQKARAIVFESFALEAAQARRRNAEHLHDQGDTIGAQNEIATAKKYESFAQQWDELTAKDCNKEYEVS